MVRLVLLCFSATLLLISGAQAHGVHGGCAVGDSWMGVVPHFHPGGYGRAVACRGGGGYRDPGYGGGYGRRGYDRGYGQGSVGYGPGQAPPPQGPGYGKLGVGEAVGCPPNWTRIGTPGGSSRCLP